MMVDGLHRPQPQHTNTGIDDEPVVAKTEAQSFGSFKSFDEVHNPEGVQAWLQVLAADLVRCAYRFVCCRCSTDIQSRLLTMRVPRFPHTHHTHHRKRVSTASTRSTAGAPPC